MTPPSPAPNPYPLLTGHGDDYRLRQLLLYFIRLALHILENYVFTYLDSNNAKTKASRRKAMRAALEQYAAIAKKPDFLNSSHKFGFRKHILFDFSSRTSTDILQCLTSQEQQKLYRFFKDELRLSDLSNFNEFLEIIFLLRSYRHFLEHYSSRVAKGNLPRLPEEDLFSALGRVLLPSYSGLLQGKLGRKPWRKDSAESIKKITEGRNQRKTARTQYKNSVLRRQKMDKAKRKKLHKDNETFREKYQEWFPHHQRHQAYKLENFRDYFFAIGREGLEKLKTSGRAETFAELEQLYKMHHDIGLRLALIVTYLHEKWIGSDEANEEKFKTFIKSRPNYSDYEEEYKILIKIRNHVAHGRLVLLEEDPNKVFDAIFILLRLEREKEYLNLFRDEVLRICKTAKRIVIWRQQNEKSNIWSKEMDQFFWSPKERKKADAIKSAPEAVKVDRYWGLRSVAKLWVKALNEAYEKNKLENVKK